MARAKKQVIFHIGSPKTATTALQAFLSENAGTLARAGFLYPKNEKYFHWNGHHAIPQKIVNDLHPFMPPSQRALSVDEICSALLYDIETSSTDVLLSSEFFWMFTRDSIVDRLDDILSKSGAQPRFIVYLRRPDEYLWSWYLQSCSTGWETRSFHDWLIPHLKGESYKRRLSIWARKFGKESIDIRCFDPEFFVGGNIATDFCSVLNVHNLPKQVSEQNVSPSTAFAAFGRALAAEGSLPLENRVAILGKLLSSNPSLGNGLPGLQFSKETRNGVITYYTDEIRDMIADYKVDWMSSWLEHKPLISEQARISECELNKTVSQIALQVISILNTRK